MAARSGSLRMNSTSLNPASKSLPQPEQALSVRPRRASKHRQVVFQGEVSRPPFGDIALEGFDALATCEIIPALLPVDFAQRGMKLRPRDGSSAMACFSTLSARSSFFLAHVDFSQGRERLGVLGVARDGRVQGGLGLGEAFPLRYRPRPASPEDCREHRAPAAAAWQGRDHRRCPSWYRICASSFQCWKAIRLRESFRALSVRIARGASPVKSWACTSFSKMLKS